MTRLNPEVRTPRKIASSIPISAREEPVVPLRPGVLIPDWSAVHDESARAALASVFSLIGIGRRKWSALDPGEDRVWRTLLTLFGERGRAPVAAEIAHCAGLPVESVSDALRKLHARDVLILDGEGRILGAYPFSERPTAHHVEFGGRNLTAMCAIDALGVGAMFGVDTKIASSCLRCGAEIYIETRPRGIAITAAIRQTALVWAGLQYSGGCSATSLCTVLAFFCSDKHLNAWRSSRGANVPGFRLSLEAALEVGRALFGPMLKLREENS